MKTKVILLLFSATIFCRAATEDLYITDGNSLQDHIRVWRRVNDGDKSRLNGLIAAFTVQYISGFFDGASIWQHYDRESCPYSFPSIQSREFIQVAAKYLSEHPEELHKPAADILARAATVAYPNREFKPHNSGRDDRSHM